MSQPPQSTIEHDEERASSLRCATCDYDLRALPTNGLCPECGTAISESMRLDRLESSDPLFVSSCAWGIPFLIVSLASSVCSQAIGLLAGVRPTSVQIFRLSQAIGVFQAFEIPGLWLLLTPILPGRDGSRRWLMRIAVVLIALRHARIVESLASMVGNDTLDWRYSTIAAGLLTGLMHVLIFLRLRDLARRSERSLEQHARMAMGLNLIFIGLVMFVPQFVKAPEIPAGLLIFLLAGVGGYTIYAWWRFRAVLAAAAIRARDNWNAARNARENLAGHAIE